MERQGLVEREKAAEDARGMTATLTGAGLERLHDAYPYALASVRTNDPWCQYPGPGRASSVVTVAGRPGRITDEPVATATFLPSASNTSQVPMAMLRPRWITVPRAVRSRPSGATGRRKYTLRSTGPNAVPAGSVVCTEPSMAVPASMAMAPP